MSSDVSVRSGDKNSHVYCCSLVLISYLIQNQVVETSTCLRLFRCPPPAEAGHPALSFYPDHSGPVPGDFYTQLFFIAQYS